MLTIRTALLNDSKAYMRAGDGWVNISEPEVEFQETVNKSKAMLKAVRWRRRLGKIRSGQRKRLAVDVLNK